MSRVTDTSGYHKPKSGNHGGMSAGEVGSMGPGTFAKGVKSVAGTSMSQPAAKSSPKVKTLKDEH